MIIWQNVFYRIEKKRFGWYRVYEDGVLHSKFKYQASAVNFVNLKLDQTYDEMNKVINGEMKQEEMAYGKGFPGKGKNYHPTK